MTKTPGARKVSIRLLLVGAILAVTLLPAAVISLWLWYSAKETLLQDSLIRAKQAGQVEVALLENEFRRVINILENKSDPLAFVIDGKADETLIPKLVEKLQKRESAFVEIAIFNERYEVIHFFQPEFSSASFVMHESADEFLDEAFFIPEGASIDSMPALAVAMAGRVFIGAAELHDGYMSILLSVPIGDMENPVGVFIGRIHIENLLNDILSSRQPGEEVYRYLVNRRGELIASAIGAREEVGNLLTAMPIVRAALANQVWSENQTFTGLSGSTVYGNYTPLTLMNWTLISELPTENIVAPIAKLLRNGIIFILVATGILVVLGIMAVSKMMSHVDRITKASELAASSSRNQRMPTSLIAEFDVMYRSFENMIEARNKTEVGIKEALTNAELASQAKTRFLATMSHEFRTPLNAILGFSDMMRSRFFGPLGSDKYEEYVDSIHVSGQHMLGLVNDVLDISAIEAGKRTLSMENLALGELLEECRKNVEPSAAKSGIMLTLDLQDNLPPLHGDRRSITQIVLNLLSNAIKFSVPNGKVTVSAAVDDQALCIKVIDNGIGIPPDVLPNITEPFAHSMSDPHTAQDGTGLGLSIVKALVDAHHGELSIESALSEGTTVTLRFQTEQAA